jgi:hypothetical protein
VPRTPGCCEFTNLLNSLQKQNEADQRFDMRQERSSVVNAARELERGRECYGRRAWAGACQALSLADKVVPLAVEDLELLAMSAYLIARDDDYLTALERAYNAYLDAGKKYACGSLCFLAGFAPSL